MPVHHAPAGRILVIRLDGDYTLGELERVLERVPAYPGVARPARILLDLSGTSTVAARSDAELRDTAALFTALGDALDRVALLTAGQWEGDFLRVGTAFANPAGLRASPFRDRGAAMAWLGEGGSG